MDYAKFLNKTEELVLAYLGGPHAHGKDRRVRVDEPRPAPGFHRFELKGRQARVLEAVDSPSFEGLPKARGHFVRGWVVSSDVKSRVEAVQLMPAEEPMPFAILRARRWHSDDLIFEALDFDGEVEETARLILEKKEPLGELKGVPATLRTAFGIALISKIAAEMHIPISVREALPHATKVADGLEARPLLVGIQARREEEANRTRIHAILAGQRPRGPITAYRTRPRDNPTPENAAERAEAALDAARARMLSSRHLGGGTMEVAFQFMNERFISVVDVMTLHVYDSGVCLAGADELVTLDSLPGVIREAIDDGVLVITRR